MSERTVTILLEEYEELTREDLVYRYSADNGHTYHWYGVIPQAREIENKLKEDYEREILRWKEGYREERSKNDRLWKKLNKIPNWIRKIYGAG